MVVRTGLVALGVVVRTGLVALGVGLETEFRTTLFELEAELRIFRCVFYLYSVSSVVLDFDLSKNLPYKIGIHSFIKQVYSLNHGGFFHTTVVFFIPKMLIIYQKC
jgi:hypothetical protein